MFFIKMTIKVVCRRNITRLAIIGVFEAHIANYSIRGDYTHKHVDQSEACLWIIFDERNSTNIICFQQHFLTLSVREPHLCLCKQVGSRPAAGLRSNLFATWSIISHKNQAEFKGFKKQKTI